MERRIDQLRQFGKSVWGKLNPNYAKKENRRQITAKWDQSIVSFNFDREPSYFTSINFGDKKLYAILSIDSYGKGEFGQLLIPVKNLLDMNYKKISVLNSLSLGTHDYSFINKRLQERVGEFNLTSQGTSRTFSLVIENYQPSEKRRITKRPLFEYPQAAEGFVGEFNATFSSFGLTIEPASPVDFL